MQAHTNHFVLLGVSLLQQPLIHPLLLPLGVMKEAVLQGIHHWLNILLFLLHLLVLLLLTLCRLFLLPPLLLLLRLHNSTLLLQKKILLELGNYVVLIKETKLDQVSSSESQIILCLH